MKGGVGSICLEAHRGFRVGALVAVNALGNVYDLEQGRTIAGARHPTGTGFLEFAEIIEKGMPIVAQPGQHTTLGVIITDVTLDHLLLTKMAQAGHDGLARAVRPVHTSFDGDTFFAVSTAKRTLPAADSLFSPDTLVHLASEAVRLAILRAVRAAHSVKRTPGLAG
jgi:L-aminopeptidase/D-esterase-like protein